MGVFSPPGSGGQTPGKNCREWALYEPAHTSTSANLCNGGRFEGVFYEPCSMRAACRVATERRAVEGNMEESGGPRRLPVLNPMSPQAVAPRYLEATPLRVPDFNRLPTSIPQQRTSQQLQQYQASAQYPQPVLPPKEYPRAMQTPFASMTPVYQGGVSPTFLPRDSENVFGRLGTNMLQGVFAVLGWHVYDYARTVDLFRS